MQLNELFKDGAYPYEWDRSSYDENWEANFQVMIDKDKEGARTVPGHVSFENHHHDLKLYEMEFSIDRKYGITETGNAIKIFSTIVAITLDFLKKVNPNVLIFSAKEKSRKKLYARMAERLTAKGFDNVSARANEYAKNEFDSSSYPRNGTRTEKLLHFLTTDVLHDDYEVYVLVKRGFLNT